MIYSLVLVAGLLAYANAAIAKEGFVFRHGFHNAGRTDVQKGARAAAHKQHDVQIAIKLRNMDIMEEVLMRVSDPAHADYGKHWTAEQVAEMTANYEGSYKVKKFLESRGARLTERYGNDDMLHFRAPISVWESVFATEFYEFSHPDFKGEKMIRAMEYYLPHELDADIDMVFKLVDLPPVISRPVEVTFAPTPVVPPASAGGPQGVDGTKNAPAGYLRSGYVTPQFLANWYNIQSAGSTNTRQAIFASLGQYGSNIDLTGFQTAMGVPVRPLAGNLGVPGHINHAMCTSNANNCAETNLDIEYITGVATNVPTYHIYYENCDYWSMFANLTSSATKNPPKVISISYGGYGYTASHAVSFNNYAILAGTLGITILVASGDDGAVNFGVRGNAGLCHYEPSFPAYSPYVTAVGATQGPEKGTAEVACSSMTGGVITTGGGFSLYDARPSWQSSKVSTYFTTVAAQGKSPVAGYASANRGYPDISLIGSNYLTQIGGVQYYTLFGTSASSPAFGGMVALINSALAAQGKTPMGFLNPFLYAYSGAFIRDVTSGSNFCTVGGTCCSQGFHTAAGWDPVTGLGVPNFELMKAAAINSKNTATTATPTKTPTRSPTAAPTVTRTGAPTTAAVPTKVPTASPTFTRTNTPTKVPTKVPTASPTARPTIVPTKIPTASPTFARTITPTAAPTYNPTLISQVTCSPYTATNTGSATTGYATCTFLACRGYKVQVSVCSSLTYGAGLCTGDTYLRVYDAAGNQVAYNDDYCTLCSSLTFTASTQCQFYTVRQGCYGSLSCGGTTAIGFYS